MTVKELYTKLDTYLRDACPNGMACSMCTLSECPREKCGERNILICDDGMEPKYFAIDSASGGKFDREVKPAKIEIQDVKYTPPGEHGGYEDYIPSYCSKCKNFIKYTGKTLLLGQKCVDCKHDGKIIHNVIEYDGIGPCMSYDPIEPVIRKMPVQVEPAEYKTEDVFVLTTDLTNKEK